jgi:hypothetical protein
LRFDPERMSSASANGKFNGSHIEGEPKRLEQLVAATVDWHGSDALVP